MGRREREEVVVATSTPFFTEDKSVHGTVSPDSHHLKSLFQWLAY